MNENPEMVGSWWNKTPAGAAFNFGKKVWRYTPTGMTLHQFKLWQRRHKHHKRLFGEVDGDPELVGIDFGKMFRSALSTLPGGAAASAAYMAVKKPMKGKAAPVPAPGTPAAPGTSNKKPGFDIKKYGLPLAIGGGALVLLMILKKGK